jgi:hypothetical protein
MAVFSSTTTHAGDEISGVELNYIKDPSPPGGGCPKRTGKERIQALAEQAFSSNVACWMSLFEAETTYEPTCFQTPARNGTPTMGYGVCTLEYSQAKRTARGGACMETNIDGATDVGIINQMKCCEKIMRDTPEYFDPVKKGKVSKCA